MTYATVSNKPKISQLPGVDLPEGRTDVANARRFYDTHGDDFRFWTARKKWLQWDGIRWLEDDSGASIRAATRVTDSIWREARQFDSNEARKWAAESASARRIGAMLLLAQVMLHVQADDLDSDNYLLNCKNGTVDLRNGKLRAHRREDFITKLSPIEFDRGATCPAFSKFLSEVFIQSDLLEFVQRLFGYGITGDVSEQVLPILHGSGANGKTTLLNAITHVVGDDFSGIIPRTLLVESRSSHHPTELTTLHSKRLMVSHESESGDRLSEALVKQLTGGDGITARGMRENFWTFAPTHKIFLLTNHKPRIKGQDHAIWRRLKLIPFNQVFDGERCDRSLPDKLKGESSGILNWLIQGCLSWQERGLAEPEIVKMATDEYRNSEDSFSQFVEEKCLIGASYKVKSSSLFREFKAWAEASGEPQMNHKELSQRVAAKGFEKKANNGIWYLGIGLIND